MVFIGKINICFLSLCAVVLSVLPNYLLSDQIPLLTDRLGFSFTTAAALVNGHDSVTGLFGVIGVTVTDHYLTRYGTILLSSLLYMTGLFLITAEWEQPNGTSTVRSFVVSGLFLTAVGMFSLMYSAYELAGERAKTPLNVLQRLIRVIIVILSILLASKTNFDYGAYMCSAISMTIIPVVSLFYLVGYFENPSTEPGDPVVEDLDQVLQEGRHGNRPLDNASLKVTICVTFLAYGMVKSIGNTFFFWQGIQMDSSIKIGHKAAEMPLQTFLLVAEFVSSGTLYLYWGVIPKNSTEAKKKCAPAIEYCLGMLMGLVCCMVASWVAMDVFEHSSGNKSKLSILWLTPQFVFWGAMDGLAFHGIETFFKDELPAPKKSYAWACAECMSGVGSLLATILVQVIKVSTNWLSDEKQKGDFRLDMFYHVLPLVATVFLVVFTIVAFRYYSQDNEEPLVVCEEPKENEQGIEDLHDMVQETSKADHIQNNQPEEEENEEMQNEEQTLPSAFEIIASNAASLFN